MLIAFMWCLFYKQINDDDDDDDDDNDNIL